MKAPGEREPVFPEETTHVVYVYGMSALERRLGRFAFALRGRRLSWDGLWRTR